MRLEDLMIDPEFKAIFDADGHTPEQLQGLEEGLEEFGYGGDRIEHWHGLIVDGYTRYGIWERKHKDNPDAPQPEIFEISAKDRKAVIRYMLSKQLNRRNVHHKRLTYYRGKLATQTLQPSTNGQPEGHVHDQTRPPQRKRRKGNTEAAKKAGVDRVTLHRSEKFAEAVDSLDARGVAKRKEMLEGTMPMSTVVKAAQATTKSEAKQILGNAAPTPVNAKLELGKRFGSPLKVLQKLNEEYPFAKYKHIEAAIREWYEQASASL
jgi:hypothetical protein